MKTVLTIAGYDPSSGAGITADLMVFAAHGLFGTSCITALTVQSTVGLRAVHGVSASVVEQTLQCLQDDTPPAGVKIGMLGTGEIVHVVCDYLERLRSEVPHVPVVLDPVTRSSSGAALLEEDDVGVLRDRLLPLVDWVTPNTTELAELTGREVGHAAAVPEACQALQAKVRISSGWEIGILAKGGHLEKPDDYIVSPVGGGVWLHGERVNTRSTHGTGCALSSAFLCELVFGRDAIQAADLAKRYVAGALRTAAPIGRGAGPMNHLWPILKPGDEL